MVRNLKKIELDVKIIGDQKGLTYVEEKSAIEFCKNKSV